MTSFFKDSTAAKRRPLFLKFQINEKALLKEASRKEMYYATM